MTRIEKEQDFQQIPEILLCFDTDGIFKCLDYYSEEDKSWFGPGVIEGPIDPIIVKDRLEKYCEIFIVSESPFFPKNEDGSSMFKLQNELPGRWLNIQESYNKYWEKYSQEPSTKLYISDNGDYNEATKAEFTYIRHDLFVKTMKSLGLI